MSASVHRLVVTNKYTNDVMYMIFCLFTNEFEEYRKPLKLLKLLMHKSISLAR